MGHGRLQQNSAEWDLSVDKGVVFSMQEALVFKSQGCSAIALSLPVASIMKHATALLGDKVNQVDFKFDGTIDLTTPLGKSLRSSVIHAAHEMNGPLGSLDNPIAITNLENYLLSQFIALHPNSFMHYSQQAIAREIMPYHIKRARDYIHDHAHEKVTLHDLSICAGCSFRTLQTLFNKILGMSPMAYLKVIRLEQVHVALLNADYQVSSVADIAKQWGFTHMGRLAESYKKKYGINPSDTLRK